jgi:type IV fimbrial biogenesis protein FimT
MDGRGLYNMNMAKTKGFTLIELLITIVVVSVLLAAGVPSLMEFIKNNKLTAQANSLVAAIQITRSEAVKRGAFMVICAKSPDDVTCSGDNDWTNGWIVFSDLDQQGDLDGNGNCTVADDNNTKDCVQRTITAQGNNTLTSNASSIQFQPDGQAANAAATTFTLTADNCKQQQVRGITITRQGHATIAKQDCP